MKFTLVSKAFQDGQPIPVQYTGDGRDLSPPLQWSDPPENTRGFAVICEDPDAPRGVWTHWLLLNIPAESRELTEGVAKSPTLPDGSVQGANDFGKVGYGGPAPPPGKPHRYFFKLYALDQRLDLPAGTKKDRVAAALQGHILAEAQHMGTYGRAPR